MSCEWKGNTGTGHSLVVTEWFTHLRAQGLSKEDEHPPTAHMGYGRAHVLVLKAFTLNFSA